jgi:putative phosphoesterase
MIIHAGDLEQSDVLEWLGRIAPVEAVAGNMDTREVKATLPAKRVLELGGFRIGLVHGWGPPSGVPGRAVGAFAGEEVDLIVFGHTHQPGDLELEGMRLFNPGSPTDRVFSPYRSVGLLTLADEIETRIIRLD